MDLLAQIHNTLDLKYAQLNALIEITANLLDTDVINGSGISWGSGCLSILSCVEMLCILCAHLVELKSKSSNQVEGGC